MTPIADIARIARCIGNRAQYPWRFSKPFVPQLRASRRSKRKRGKDNCRHSLVRLRTTDNGPLTQKSGGQRQLIRRQMSDVRRPKKRQKSRVFILVVL